MALDKLLLLLSSLSIGTILPDCSGTSISGPFSPTQYGTPAFTGPPSSLFSSGFLLAAEGSAAGVVLAG